MTWLIVLRFLMRVGLGAEVVVAAARMMEFVPAAPARPHIATPSRSRPIPTVLANIGGSLLIPVAGWQVMFVIAGVGALVIWVLRKNMPESPSWLESQGRFEEAEHILRLVEAEAYPDCRTIGASKPRPSGRTKPHPVQPFGHPALRYGRR